MHNKDTTKDIKHWIYTHFSIEGKKGQLIETFKILNGLDKLDIDKLFTLNEKKKLIGNQLKVYQRIWNTKMRRNFFTHKVLPNLEQFAKWSDKLQEWIEWTL